jgi:AcrR family transcriptional regulator
METTQPRSIRQRGRPRGKGSQKRHRLLAAAREALTAGAPQDLNLRQLAQAAGVTPALANYYFGSRDGLIDALFREHLAPRIDEQLVAARARAHRPQQAITVLMQRTSALLTSDTLLRRCLWLQLPAASQMRSRLRTCLLELVVRAQNVQAMRADLPPDYLVDSLLGLVLFQFVEEHPATAAGPDGIAELMLRHIALLRDGILHQRK